MTQQVGSIAGLWRYPVKSVGGEACERIDLDARGVAGDRRYAILNREGKLGSGKTTRRFRQIDGLLDLRAVYQEDVPELIFRDGTRMLGSDPQIHAALSNALNQAVTLGREQDVPHLDAGPVHLITTAALAWLRATLPESQIDERRFRPNLVIDVPGSTQVELDWIGRTLAIGNQVKLRVIDRTGRCRMVTLPQQGIPNDPRVLGSIIRDADSGFGVYAEVVSPGTIARGDCCTLAA